MTYAGTPDLLRLRESPLRFRKTRQGQTQETGPQQFDRYPIPLQHGLYFTCEARSVSCIAAARQSSGAARQRAFSNAWSVARDDQRIQLGLRFRCSATASLVRDIRRRATLALDDIFAGLASTPPSRLVA